MSENNSTLKDTRAQLMQALLRARYQTDILFTLLKKDSYFERPIPERHRILFYLGHLETFDWNQVTQNSIYFPSLHPEFDKLFAFGIDPDSRQLPQDKKEDWPSIFEINEYNDKVRKKLDSILSLVPLHILHTCIEHRLMHAETLTYILHNLPFDKKYISKNDIFINSDKVKNQIIHIPGGNTTLGADKDISFGWDNEFESHVIKVPAFHMDRYKVTNGDYLKFVMEGGPVPYFWYQKGNQWFYRSMFSEIPLPMQWPVYVTHQQATAYAKWQKKSLPTEAQFHRAAYGTESDFERQYPWGDQLPNNRYGNFNFYNWDPIPVNATPSGDSAFGISQLVGNGWEWTSSLFNPFPGFKELEHYPGYSRNFFDNAHYVLKGGSPRTADRLLRRSFRNWFRADYPYLYATFRCVK